MSSFDQKFLFVSGKGGVGKTTTSVAIARHLAANGRRVLLTVGEAAPAGRLLGGEPSTEISRFGLNLEAVLIEPEVALREYAGMVLGSRAAVTAAVDNRYSRSFLKAVPGLYPWAVLGKAWYHATERQAGRPRFDTVVFDAPATGHGLEMLQVPRVIREAAPPGPLRRDAEKAWEMFRDPAQTGVIVVSLPEELPVSESIELAAGIRELGLPIAGAVLNDRLPNLFQPGDFANLAPRPGFSEAAEKVLAVARSRMAQETEQQRQEMRFRAELGVPVWVLPWLSNADTPTGARVLAGTFNASPP